MPVHQLHPYLHFNGEAQAAVDHYQQALGASVVNLLRYHQVPGMKVPVGEEQRVMHAELKIGAGLLMLSDAMPGTTMTVGDNTQVALAYDDLPELERAFVGLSEGGRVLFPIHDTFWGAKLGMVVDRFGMKWILTAEPRR